MSDETVGSLLDQAASRLRSMGSPTFRLDAELLVGAALGFDRVQLRTRREDHVDPEQVREALGLVERRERLEPVQYILGVAHFRRLTLAVDSRVLVPRPETEFVVEAAIDHIRRLDKDADDVISVLDLCTGSGAIALAIADEAPGVTQAKITVTATDISDEALEVCRSNADRLRIELEIIAGDLTAPVQGRSFDVVTINPPYIGRAEMPTLGIGVAEHEPHVALFTPDIDPQAFLRRVVGACASVLAPGGALAIELGAGQDAAVVAMCESAGLHSVRTVNDLAGIGRVVVAYQA